jgi:hypothetical protein
MANAGVLMYNPVESGLLESVGTTQTGRSVTPIGVAISAAAKRWEYGGAKLLAKMCHLCETQQENFNQYDLHQLYGLVVPRYGLHLHHTCAKTTQ